MAGRPRGKTVARVGYGGAKTRNARIKSGNPPGSKGKTRQLGQPGSGVKRGRRGKKNFK